KILENKDDSELNNYNKTNKITRLVTNLTYVAIVFGQSPPSWPSNRIFGGIFKDTKKPTNSQYCKYELVG
ncbi:MAG: hypothetical protein UD960_15475, partial [Phocaeicola vulgatus]|nr:hypothetical protein [Phocaeicola vulgatus]